ncbi:hypothetical protein PGT21_033626 [Puccinia graminis f. sp. tritici]|uniref:AB hydrolase-1 domain-containing protein n=1 Tax=Puccinia graminis f. sp. tritici TaxID=56615 RepID=A0A5B0R481_PUCGR|nr:hypothetical protein PGT21_033626 [Puccinia graminis f. sp. tritici]
MSGNQTPNPKDPGSFTRKSLVVSSGHRYSYIDQSLNADAQVVLLLHGFSKPTDLKAYSKLNSCKALCEILDHENIRKKVILVGHDWGSALAFRFVQHFPEKVKCWVTICVPPARPGQRGEAPPDFEKIIKQRLPHLG